MLKPTNGRIFLLTRSSGLLALMLLGLVGTISGQSRQTLTPAELQIEKQRQRLTSADVEDRRDAVMRLGAMHLPAASRAALPALTDISPMVRAVAANAILSLEPNESVAALIPLLSDKDEFVRREAVYALGLTRSRTATAAVSERLLNDREDGVRAAAAVALGDIADEGAVALLAGVLAPELLASQKGKRKPERNAFVLRAAATSLGKIRSRAGTPALIAALANEKYPDDVRREAAHSLGLIGDPLAVPALRAAANAADPYISRAAHESLRKISP